MSSENGVAPDIATVPRANVRWPGPGARVRLERTHRRLLRRRLGVDVVERGPSGQVRVPPGRLDPAAVAALRSAVGAAHVRTGAADRLARAGGMSYLDLLHRRDDDTVDAPDAVVAPATHDEVVAVLGACEEHGIAVVPYGGGTSVVGGLGAGNDRYAITLDLSRMNALVDVDEVSQTATMQPGLTGPDAECLLGEQGLTLGHFPQSWECSTVGGWVATRSAGQLSTGVGRIDDLVVALRVATPRGTLELGRGPRSAAGPDLRELFVGSEGALGVITEVRLQVRPAPTVRRYLGWSFPDFAAGLAALRRLRQDGVAPDLLRLSDGTETAVTLDLAGRQGRALRAYQRMRGHPGGCLVITGWEGTSNATVRARRALADPVLRAEGGVPLGERVGESWLHGRYGAPYLRDALLDASMLAETLETAADWSSLRDLHAAVTGVLTRTLTDLGTPPVVMAHVSHAYPTGASLYITVIARRLDDDPAGQWWAAKRAALDAITDHGATITHHHAVGADHRPWMTDEVGALGVEVLRAVKRTVDPAGILNPAVLIPPEG